MPVTLNASSTGSGGFITSADGSGVLVLQTNGTNAISIDTAQATTFAQGATFSQNATFSQSAFVSQNVGIGTTSPLAKFDLVGDYREGVVTANTGTAYTINTATGTLQILTLTGNCTFTFPALVAGESFTLLLRQDATGSRTVTWPASVRWPGNTAPTITATASRTDKYIFTCDGTRWYGSNAGQNYTA